MTVTLSGITWDHPRGHAPLAASIGPYRELCPDVEIAWTVRSLRDFGELPLEGLVQRFDMVVYDHPFVGQALARGLLRDLTPYIGPAARDDLDQGALGPSWRSYHWHGGIYGLPIDAAAQVAAWRPDLLAKAGRHPPATFAQVLELAHELRQHGLWIAMTGCPTDAICQLMTLAANRGWPAQSAGKPFLAPEAAVETLEMLKRLIAVCHPDSSSLNPIQALDRMSGADEIAYVPYTFGYSHYAQPGRARSIRFGDIVAAGDLGCAGALLGGAGFGVTTRCAHPEAAAAYGLHLCASSYQRGPYVRDGGQPGMRQAWEDPAVDAAADGFFSGTLRTLTSAYLRPRIAGFVPFFEDAGKRVNACLRGEASAEDVILALNQRYDALLETQD